MKLMLYTLLLTSLAVNGLPTASVNAYQATGVQHIEANNAGETGELLDIAFALMPQIEELVKNVTQNSSPSEKETQRFKFFIDLFVPIVRKTMEFKAQDEGRTIQAKDLEALELVEFAVHYISDVAFSQGASLAEASGVVIPDYTDLLLDTAEFTPDIPDIFIPAVNIPETKIPDIEVSKINIPGGSDIPARTIPIENIPSVVFPPQHIAVTSVPLPGRRKSNKVTTNTAARSGSTNLRAQANTESKKTPASAHNPASSFSVKVPESISKTEGMTFYSLPGGGYFYSAAHNG